jgi:DnaJ-domain-containing protein 1
LAWWAFGGLLRLPGVGRGDATAGRAADEVPRGGAPRDGAREGAGRDGAALADLRAARAAGAREGFQAGLKQGRAEGFTEAMRQAQAQAPASGRPRAPEAASATARPRTRAEALRVLDLPDAATIEQVEERYRQLRRAAHPDNFPRTKYPRAFTELAEAEFKRLGEARDLLVR